MNEGFIQLPNRPELKQGHWKENEKIDLEIYYSPGHY